MAGRIARSFGTFVAAAFTACGGDSHRTDRCGECTILVERGTTFGELEGPASFLGDPSARQDRRGRFYVAGHGNDGVLVFDSTGRYLTTIGRRGPGPDEFELISAFAIGLADTVLVFDRRHSRVTLISPSHEIVRIAPVPEAPIGNGLAILADGRAVIAVPRTTGGVRHPLHLLRADFSIERSFGRDAASAPVPNSLAEVRRPTTGGTGQVWSSRLLEYVLELWSLDGTKLREIRRTADWLPPPPPRRERREGEPLPPPDPAIVAIDLDDDGFLWVLGRIVDRNWLPPRLERVPEGWKPIDDQLTDDAYDTVIEVFDTETDEMVASVRHPLAFNQFARSRTLIHRDEIEDGRFRLSSYRIRFEGR